MEGSVAASHCVICSASIEFIPDSKKGSSSSDSKLANAFIQCLTLDPAYIEDLTIDNLYCPECKLYLDEWDFCQNEMTRLMARLRQLKASLVAKLLESTGQPMPETCSKLQIIRRTIKRRFDPQVVLEKTDSSDLRKSNKFRKYNTEGVQVEEDHPDTGDCGNFVQVKVEDFSVARHPGNLPESSQRNESPAIINNDLIQCSKDRQNLLEAPELIIKATPTFSSDLVREVKPGEYLYRDKIRFYYKYRRFTCGHCKHAIRSKAKDMQRHLSSCEKKEFPIVTPMFNSDLIKQVKPGEYLYRDKIRFYYKYRRFTCGHCKHAICGDATNMQKHLSRCEKKEIPPVRTPIFRSDLIKQVKPGEYLYRDKISFYYKDGCFRCGRCYDIIRGGKSNMQKHLRFCGKRENTPCETSIFETALCKEVGPGEYLYRDKIPFYCKGKAFTCGWCKAELSGTKRKLWNVSLKRHLSRCYTREFLLKTSAPSPTASTEPPAVSCSSPEIHFTCDACGLQFHGADSEMQNQTHVATVHANSPHLRQPPGQQQPNLTGIDPSSAEPGAAMVKTETCIPDVGLIVPDVTGDEFEDSGRRESCSGGGEIDPLQLMKIDFDCLKEEIG